MKKLLTAFLFSTLLTGAAFAETSTKEPSNVTHKPAAEKNATYDHHEGAKEKHAEKKADEKDAAIIHDEHHVVNGVHADGTVHVDGDYKGHTHEGVVDHKDVTDQHKTH